jgi:3',5'-cyclic AMP phosphodiesterase CpdA
MKLVHLSDTHYGVGKNAYNLIWVVTWMIANLDHREHIIVFTGDLVDSPKVEWYKAVAELLWQLRDAGFVVLTVPGNHDIHDLGVDVGFGRDVGRILWERYIDPASSWGCEDVWPKRFNADGVHLIGIDTNEGTSGDWVAHMACGEVGDSQMLMMMLYVQDKPCVVLGHHRLLWDDPLHRLLDADEVFEILDGQSWGYVCGHQHKQDRRERNGMVCLASRRTTQPEDGHLQITIIDLVEGLPSTIVDIGSVSH